jgi:hypothetical protein
MVGKTRNDRTLFDTTDGSQGLFVLTLAPYRCATNPAN